MRSHHSSLTAGSLLRWGGLLAVVFALALGILGMHVIGGVQAASMTPAAMHSTVAAPAAAALERPVSTHAHGMAEAHSVPSQPGPLAACGCMPSGCAPSMAMHGACVPSVGVAVLSVPVPGTSTQLAAPAVYTAVPGHKSSGRVPDPPSLNQLSISRT